jgi:hypothetical protein
MKAIVLLSAICFFVGCKPSTTQKEVAAAEPVQNGIQDSLVLSYFIETVTKKVKASVKDYDKQGLAGGVDGFLLIKTYPKLLPQDFIGVRATGGEYSVQEGKLLYTGNAASNSPVLTRAGMQTLAENGAARLRIPLTTKADVAQLLAALER